jgi:5'-nucleotidase/UDP-sugar diphosphatase
MIPSFVLQLARAASLALTLAAVPAGAAEVSFVLMNDIDRASVDGPRGGFARVAGAVAAERKAGGTVVVVHAGDTISPSLLSGIDKGKHIVELLNMMQLDVFVPGNHEYDFGKEVFLERMAELKAGHKLAANLAMPDGSPVAGFAATATVKVGDVTIGFVGLTADVSYAVSSPGDLKIAGTVDTGISAARALKAGGADLVVAVVHGDHFQDIRLMHSGAIDVVLSGHDEDLFLDYDGRGLIAEAYKQGEYLPVVTLNVAAAMVDGKRRVSWTPSFKVVDTATVTPDPAIAEKVAALEATMTAALAEPIAVTTTELDSRRAVVRGEEAAIGDLIADALRASTGADMALMNGGGIRGNRTYPAGTKLSRKDILSELPFGNVAVVLELSGDQVKAALENGFSAVEEGAGRFPQISGAKVVADLAKPAGSRVASVEIGAAPLDPAKTYRIATNDFMARGGDDYVILRKGKPIVAARDGKLLATVVADYIAAAETVSPKADGRIVITGK